MKIDIIAICVDAMDAVRKKNSNNNPTHGQGSRMYGGVVRRIGMTCSKSASSCCSHPSALPLGWMNHVIPRRRLVSSKVHAHPPTYETLTALERNKIDGYLDLLLDWNTRMNLTGMWMTPMHGDNGSTNRSRGMAMIHDMGATCRYH